MIVVGAGLAGLTAAVDLHCEGARVIVLEARDRVGGRVWTRRDGFLGGQHAEAGGDLVEDGQEEILRLARRLGLRLTPILRRGFSFVRQDPHGRPLTPIAPGTLWTTLGAQFAPLVRAYRLAEQRWDSTIGEMMGHVSVAEWLDRVGAGEELRAIARGLRGFFLTDPDDLSLLALVDQLASEASGPGNLYRIKGGNDRLTSGLAALLGERVRLRTALLAVSQARETVRVTMRTAGSLQSQMVADYVILAVPATTLRPIIFEPPLPPVQREAIRRLHYGRATKTLLQFKRRFWRRRGRPRAYGTDLPIGAVWEGNEEQPGREGILTLLAGGSASVETKELVAGSGVEGLVRSLEWLGAKGIPVLAHRLVSWEDDPWAQGGYAYFDPAYDPALRPWLARAHGLVLFAGEHTSVRWQGYMNGAVESGLRAAAEVRTMAGSPRRRRRARD